MYALNAVFFFSKSSHHLKRILTGCKLSYFSMLLGSMPLMNDVNIFSISLGCNGSNEREYVTLILLRITFKRLA